MTYQPLTQITGKLGGKEKLLDVSDVVEGFDALMDDEDKNGACLVMPMKGMAQFYWPQNKRINLMFFSFLAMIVKKIHPLVKVVDDSHFAMAMVALLLLMTFMIKVVTCLLGFIF